MNFGRAIIVIAVLVTAYVIFLRTRPPQDKRWTRGKMIRLLKSMGITSEYWHYENLLHLLMDGQAWIETGIHRNRPELHLRIVVITVTHDDNGHIEVLKEHRRTMSAEPFSPRPFTGSLGGKFSKYELPLDAAQRLLETELHFQDTEGYTIEDAGVEITKAKEPIFCDDFDEFYHRHHVKVHLPKNSLKYRHQYLYSDDDYDSHFKWRPDKPKQANDH